VANPALSLIAGINLPDHNFTDGRLPFWTGIRNSRVIFFQSTFSSSNLLKDSQLTPQISNLRDHSRVRALRCKLWCFCDVTMSAIGGLPSPKIGERKNDNNNKKV